MIVELLKIDDHSAITILQNQLTAPQSTLWTTTKLEY